MRRFIHGTRSIVTIDMGFDVTYREVHAFIYAMRERHNAPIHPWNAVGRDDRHGV